MIATTASTVTPEVPETDRKRMTARVAELKKAKDAQLPVWRDLQDYIAPYRGRLQPENQNQRGRRKGLKIINGTATRSMSILSSGMMAGLTSPGRPWFKLNTPDPDLSEFTPVRQWLDDVARSMRAVLSRSNFYNVMPSIYGELGPFGTACLLEVEDPHALVRFYPFTLGSYSIAQDNRLVVDTLVREYRPTLRQLVGQFGDINLSESARQQLRLCKYENEVDAVHVIRPNLDRREGGLGWAGMPFIEEYWEVGGNLDQPLFRGGFRERAHFVPRWDVTGDDLWGTGIGHSLLGDVKQLQFLERRKEDVLDKHTAPPLEVSNELRGKRLSLLSGDATYTNPSVTGGAQVRPIIQTNPTAYQYAAEDIKDLQLRIRSASYEDLFLMLSNDTRSGITAREVEERHQEKMLVLGPVLERLNEELFDPTIDRTYAIMERQSKPFWNGQLRGIPLLPAPPKDIQNQDIRVEYTSILAQAAKATNTRGLEAFGQFLVMASNAKMAADQAGIGEKVDWDQFVDEYADAQGVPARVVVGDDEVKLARDEKAKQAKQQQLLAAAPAMKDMATAANQVSQIPQNSPFAQAANAAFTQYGGPPQ